MNGQGDYSGFPYINYKLLYIYITLFSQERMVKNSMIKQITVPSRVCFFCQFFIIK